MRSTLLLAALTLTVSLASAQAPGDLHIGSVQVPLPGGAILVQHPHGRGLFGGTRIRLEDRLTVELAALPLSSTPLRWYADSVAEARNSRVLPAWRMAPAVARQVGGRTAWVLRPGCGDCEAVEVYLDLPGTRLVAAWGVDGLDGLTAEQRHALAWSFLASLHPSSPRND